ncbi:PREDICTED: nuclear speckle splicing regulatory protein 1 [Camelina sativa]|uniref:Nuclear speckle splicing regulatory protein 1 n=1 Tax=Camelina sativa TaxID=90675 RepID=A0ABM0Z5Q6_CAMSA|nr:PREDICTED: nuclear speckle splicing regulatory protein 1 [Camelina sativa]
MKKYGLQIRAPSQKKQSSSRPPLRPAASIFGEDEDHDVEKEISRQASKTKALKEIEEQHKKALEEDPSAFAYDEVYDDMKQKAVLPRIQDRQERQPRYIQNLMKQAERRNKEHEIVYERKLAKEREKDEHLFSDKEKFVTGAYKRKLEEQKKWLAEERLRELREERDDVTKKKDLSDFYFNIGKNVAFGARDVEAKEAEMLEERRNAEKLDEQRNAEKLEEQRMTKKLEELRKEETREDRERKSLEKEMSPESGDIRSSHRTSVEPQEAVSDKKMGTEGTEERESSIKDAAKEVPKPINDHKKREDAIAAAKERFMARKRAKLEA